MEQPEGMVPVSPERHGGRFWRRFTSYDFARPLRHVSVALAELEQVAANLPVVFAETETGTGTGGAVRPVALLRLAAQGRTPFVSPEGRWLGGYVPSALRVHPFAARPAAPDEGADDDGRMTLLVDESSGLVTDDARDERFFAPEGGPSPALEEVVTFFRRRAASERAAVTACAALAARGLLVAPDPGTGLAADLRVVDRAALAALDDDGILALHHAGALALAQGHFVSLAHLPLIRHVEARGTSAPAAAAPEPPGDDRVSGFLDALARAQAAEPTDTGTRGEE